jgi:hypothetical protein
MRYFCALLAQELLRWPDVSMRPMFGLHAFYRGGVVFAMVPNKRALESATAIAYKLEGGGKKREGEKWRFFELGDGGGLSGALACLDKAYRKAIL